jgi:hypothetical protein
VLDTRLHPLLSATVRCTALPRDHAAEAFEDTGVGYCWQSCWCSCWGIAQNLWNVHISICTVPEAIPTLVMNEFFNIIIFKYILYWASNETERSWMVSLFNDAASNTDYAAMNGRTTIEINRNVCEWKQLWPCLRHYHVNGLMGHGDQGNSWKICQDSHCPSQDSNKTSHLEPTCSFVNSEHAIIWKEECCLSDITSRYLFRVTEYNWWDGRGM